MKRLDEVLRATSATTSPGGTGGSFNADQQLERDDLPGDPACAICHGGGFVQRDVQFGHPDFGRAVPCRCVLDEGDDERQDRLHRYSNLGTLTRQTFESLIQSGRSPDPAHRERFAAAYDDAVRFAERPEGWLAFAGVSGTGKTHLAAAIANRLIEQGIPVFFAVVPDLLDHLRTAYGPGSELPYDRLFETVRNAPVLVLDALGAQASTPWAEEKLFQIVNHRYNAQLPTIITTASPLEDLDERVRTRMQDPALTRLHLLEDGPGRLRGLPDALNLPLIRQMTFSSFSHVPSPPDISLKDAENLKRAYEWARNYARNLDGWLTFIGGTGAGKSHLAAAIAHEVRASGRPAHFVVVPDLLDHLRTSLYADERERGEVIEIARTAPFLVLDDLGVHSATAWAQEKLFQILNHRYYARLATVITVSGSLNRLPEEWASRMYDQKVGIVFHIEAPDHRSFQPRTARAEQPRRPRGR